MRTIVFQTFIIVALMSSAFAQSSTLPLTSEIETYLQDQIAKGFSGSVLVVRGGKVLVNNTYGFQKMKSPPVFWLASNSKQFTATAILKLQEQGKLSVKDPITKFFKDVPPDKQTITIHQLLSHTSGLASSYVAEGIANREEAAKAILAIPLKLKIGQGYLYSNDGYNLLAVIVEIASGKTFENYLQTVLFKSAGLKQTGFWGYENKIKVASLANPETAKKQKATIYKDGKSIANWGYRGAGGLFSTTNDVYLWLKALQNGKILTKANLEQMWSPQVLMKHSSLQKAKDICYGYGWGVVMLNGKRYEVNHAGEDDWLGHNGVIHLYENGNAYIVLSNSGNQGDNFWSAIISEFLSEKLKRTTPVND